MEGKVLYWTNYLYQYQLKNLKLSDYKIYIQDINNTNKTSVNNEIFHVKSIKEIKNDNNVFSLTLNEELVFHFKTENKEICDLWINIINLNKTNYEAFYDEMYKCELKEFNFDFYYKLQILKELGISLDKIKMDDDLQAFLCTLNKQIEGLSVCCQETENINLKINLSNPIEYKFSNKIKELKTFLDEYKVQFS